MQIGEKNKKEHLCVGRVERREKMLYYITIEGWIFEYKPKGRPKKIVEPQAVETPAAGAIQ